MKLMEKAVQYDGGLNQVQVKYHLEVDNMNRIELQTVLEAMDVSQFISILLIFGTFKSILF